MIQTLKGKTRKDKAEAAEQDVPAEVNERSADVSEEAACCVADIDDVLSDTEETAPAETEEEQARRERREIYDRYQSREIDRGEALRLLRVWEAQYGHLSLGCVC